MTIQLYDTFKPRLARMNATSKFVKAWESKNAKRALKGGGVSLMALSLAACGDEDTTLFDGDDIVEAKQAGKEAALTDVNNVSYPDVDTAITSNDLGLITSDNATIASDAAKTALTSADGVEHANVDAAILSNDATVMTSNDQVVVNIATSEALTDLADNQYTSVDAAITSNDAGVTSAALTDANDVEHDDVDQAITSNDAGVTSAALTDANDVEHDDVDQAITSNDAGVTSAALTDANDVEHDDVDQAITSNDAGVTSAALTDANDVEHDDVDDAITSNDAGVTSAALTDANDVEHDDVDDAITSNDAGVTSAALTDANDVEHDDVDDAITSNDAGVTSAALTDANDVEHDDVDDAITSNDAGVTSAALTDANDVEHDDVDQAITSNDAGVRTAALTDKADVEHDDVDDAITSNDATVIENAMTAAGTSTVGVAADITQLNNFIDAQARTLDDDNETIDLTTSTSNTIIVHGEGAGADSLDGTVVTASGAVVFDFTDAADTVVLSTASDLTGVTDIDIQGGTVDFTALGGGVNTLAGVNITAASGSILTGSQFLVAANVGGLDHNLVLELKATDDVDAILTKLQSADVDLAELKVFAPADLLTPTQKTALESLTNTTVTDLDGGAVDTTNNAPTLSLSC